MIAPKDSRALAPKDARAHKGWVWITGALKLCSNIMNPTLQHEISKVLLLHEANSQSSSGPREFKLFLPNKQVISISKDCLDSLQGNTRLKGNNNLSI